MRITAQELADRSTEFVLSGATVVVQLSSGTQINGKLEGAWPRGPVHVSVDFPGLSNVYLSVDQELYVVWPEQW